MERHRAAWAAATALLVALPFLVVTFPPITDLPQQAAQIRLLAEALGDADAGYRVQWWTPYWLAYLPLAVAHAVFAPVTAARIGTWLLACLWVGAVSWVAARRGRSVAAAVLASAFVFNHVLYWGFLSFLVGFPAFLIWLVLLERPPNQTSSFRREAATYLAGAALLYFSHALWFAVGALWLVLRGATARWPAGTWAARLLGTAPVALTAAVWFLDLRQTTFGTPPLWQTLPWERLAPGALAEGVLGGLRGPLEPLVFAAVALWIAGALWTHRRRAGEAVDGPLLGAALLLLGLSLVLPTKFSGTLEFARRWMPMAATLAVLGAPRWEIRPALRRALALVVLAGLCLGTAYVWRDFERSELAGLEEALEALPAEPQVLGLAFDAQSPRIDGLPYLQTFAWAQVVRGGDLNFSFALFPSSWVIYDPVPPRPWTEGLEWFPERLRSEDFAHFTHVLAGTADERTHRLLAAAPELAPVTDGNVWRLYRVDVGDVNGTRSTAPPGPTAPY